MSRTYDGQWKVDFLNFTSFSHGSLYKILDAPLDKVFAGKSDLIPEKCIRTFNCHWKVDALRV
jgi:hypothetical protein